MLGIDVLMAKALAQVEIENEFVRMVHGRVGAVVVLPSSSFTYQRRQIAELAIKYQLPSMFVSREFAEAGGLMSYGSDYADQIRSTVLYVDKILKGAKPADLPIEQPTRLNLVINLKTAKALGIKIPQELLLRADRVIQ